MSKQERINSFLRLIEFLNLEEDKEAVKEFLEIKLKEKSSIDTAELDMRELLSNYFNCITLSLESADYVELRDLIVQLLYLSKESRVCN
jgi:hypothetical protein